MAERLFVIRSQNATMKVIENDIKPVNSRFYSGFLMPVSITFPRISEHHGLGGNYHARWLSFEGVINLAGLDETLFTFQRNVTRDIFAGYEIKTDLYLECSKEKLDLIERSRTGDLPLKIRTTVFLEIHNSLMDIRRGLADERNEDNDGRSLLTSIESFYVEIDLKIGKSHWVENILSAIYEPFMLIQVPRTNSIENSTSLAELSKAEEYFLLGDYDKVVGHCRSALQPIREKHKNLKEWIKNGKDLKDWGEGVVFSTYQWLDSQNRLLADITNKTHHTEPLSFGHFSRSDAEAIFLVTVGVISVSERIAPVGKLDNVGTSKSS